MSPEWLWNTRGQYSATFYRLSECFQQLPTDTLFFLSSDPPCPNLAPSSSFSLAETVFDSFAEEGQLTDHAAGPRTDALRGVHAPSLWFLTLSSFPGLTDELLRCPPGRNFLEPIISVYLISQTTLSTQNNNGPTAMGKTPMASSCFLYAPLTVELPHAHERITVGASNHCYK